MAECEVAVGFADAHKPLVSKGGRGTRGITSFRCCPFFTCTSLLMCVVMMDHWDLGCYQISMGAAIDELCQSLALRLDLDISDPESPQSQGRTDWVVEGSDEAVAAAAAAAAAIGGEGSGNSSGSDSGSDSGSGNGSGGSRNGGVEWFGEGRALRFQGAARLREKVLREGRVLPNSILDVSRFLDATVDVDLVEACAEELAHRFAAARPTKILTVATSGLVLALPLGRLLQVPVAYARKERSVTTAGTYVASYTSRSLGARASELVLSKASLEPGDRVLLVDDLLSSGAAQEALLRIVGEAGCRPVGVAALIEKVYSAGRVGLSGFDVPVETLVRVLDVDGGTINCA